MKLSFVIPAYNEEHHIGACLDSIMRALGHDSNNIEVIVVNNASTDRTKEIALRYPGVRVVDEPHKGIVKARARGFKESTGDLVANIDADTMLTDNWLPTVIREFEKDPRLVCLSGPFIYYDLPPTTQFLVKMWYGVTYLLYLLTRFVLRVSSTVQGGNFVIRKEALVKAGGFDTSIDFYGEDTDVAKRLNKIGPVKWTFRLPMYASGRRLAEDGLLATGLRYAINYFWIIFTGKPYTNKSKDIRSAKTAKAGARP